MSRNHVGTVVIGGSQAGLAVGYYLQRQGLPFVIVRESAKEYGTANRLEGVFEEGDLVCLLEDVVTSGGALAEAVTALREAGLVVRNAVCVVDREEGGADALARIGVRLRCLYRAGELVPNAKGAENPHG